MTAGEEWVGGKRYTALGDWSRSEEMPGRRRRPTIAVALSRVLVRIGVVESLCCASCGCWRITTRVAVWMGCAGRAWQRHTGLGREQLEQMDRQCDGDGDSGAAAVV